LAAGIAGWTALAIDNGRLYHAAEKAREAAEAANRAKDEFLATMSHELRTPLNAVLGWTLILRATVQDDVKRQRALDTIERNARAQVQIIEDLLDVSRVATGKLRLDIGVVDLVTVIDSALDAVRLAADSKRIQIKRQADRTAALVTGDATRLQQVVSNLLTNAVKFTPAGGWIEVRLDRVERQARITVADNGQGIEASFLPYIFERFRQADGSSTRIHGGLGLGLAIVKHLVDLHGGTVRAESPGPGLGATFTVDIPLLPETAASAPGADLRLARPDPRKPLAGVRVLVVDDQPDSRDLIALILEECGAAVTSVDSVAAALDSLDFSPPDVIVSDVGMPGRNGYDLARALRERAPRYGAIPAIAVTAYARFEDRQQAMAEGFDDHVSKPIRPQELVSTVQRLVSMNRK
jgi:CheY-like chemotaxis protein/two-component sensor histidine kinase